MLLNIKVHLCYYYCFQNLLLQGYDRVKLCTRLLLLSYVYVCVVVHMCLCICVHVHMKARGLHWIPFSIIFPTHFLIHGLLLNQERADWLE